jgi:adenylate kinase
MSSVLVTGVPGIGTGAVCEQARRELGDGFDLINVGDVVLEHALERGLASTREDLASLSVSDLRLLQNRASEFVAKRAREETVIVDTNATIRTPRGLLPGFTETALRNVNPDAIVTVEASPAAVRELRTADEKRTFPDESQRAIEFHQQVNRAAVVSYATHAAAPISVLHVDGDTDTPGRLASIAEAVAPT